MTEEQKNEISIEDFARLDIRVARVLEAERVEGTKKLLKLQIEVGEEKREIVAGVAEFYAPEELIGKEIVLLANLKPAKIRGIESKGMLLAARDGENLTILTIDKKVGSGARVG